MPSPESKKGFAQTRKNILSQSGKQYWRSVEEFAGSPEFEDKIKGEFPVDVENWDPSLNRRNFMKVMGASLALAGLSGCVIQPPEKIVPYVTQPEDIIPGKPLFFATAMTLGGVATGLLAKSFDGRPVKIEGNPEHPGSLGATDIYAQASLLDMYDPDRSQETLYRGSPKSWQDFVRAIRTIVDQTAQDGGAGIRFLTETVSSPTLQDQFRRLSAEMPNARWYQYEPVNKDSAMEGARLAFGSPVNTVYRLENAQRVLSLDADIFSSFNVRYGKDFAAARALKEGATDICRLYAIETTHTLTGAKADHRKAVKPSQMPEVAKAIAAALGVGGASSTYDDSDGWIATMARDLGAFRGRSLVIVGDNQPAIVHAIAHAINGALGNVGQTVVYTDPISPYERTQIEQLRELVTDIDAGRVTTLVMLGGNPVYNTPADLKLDQDRLGKINTRIHLGRYVDETSEFCHWHISEKHYLEAWTDARAYDGTASIVQPLVKPLYDSRCAHELVQLFFRENFDKRDYDIVKEYWQTQNLTAAPAAARTTAATTSPSPAASPGTAAQSTPAASPSPAVSSNPGASPSPAVSPGSNGSAAPAPTAQRTFEDNWRKAVHDGFIQNTASPSRTVSANAAFLTQPQPPAAAGSGPLEISIRPDPSIYDGRFVNNGWLQELPNPINKVTWENVALVSPATAARLSLNRGNDPDEISGGERGIAFVNTHGNNMSSDLVTLTYQGGTISERVPVWISPGQPDDVITISMGYGRKRAGKIGTGIGYSTFDVMRSDAMSFGFGDIAKTGEQTSIASSQIHFNMEGRDILRMLDLDAYLANPNIGAQKEEYPATMYDSETGTEIYREWYKTNHKWAMSIDLNSCIGCNACVVACQAENNIPVVGKQQVEKSREMHWLRVDAYYSGTDINNPGSVAFQPLPCMQCEQAPCEVVCPVTATVHNPEGLNDMVYNRCVGTRYCSNNCPYKVRRFNFLLYQDWDTPQYKLLRNPEVSIRSRGVMEKCTYCTQRIAVARIEAEKDGRRVRDGEVLTACLAVCPTNAIVFGDMNDPVSKIAAAKKDNRD
ncbi:MAG: TAT-variant-translocated molybdopterin oxidoreductase, partial [bacterium]|nr:TAT-variant-translocated molybdopterin oxidoreductase [bacterium]